MPVYAGQSVKLILGEVYVMRGCVKRSIDLPRYTKQSFIASVASQNSSPSLRRRLCLLQRP